MTDYRGHKAYWFGRIFVSELRKINNLSVMMRRDEVSGQLSTQRKQRSQRSVTSDKSAVANH